MKFIKKGAIIDATQWCKNGDHPLDDVFRPFEDTGKIHIEPREGKIVRYYRHPQVSGERICIHCAKTMNEHGWIDTRIDTLELGHNVCPGDWIITGVRGEHYPCKNDIFLETYESAGDEK